MARYEADCCFIASIYPGKLEPIRRHYGPSRESQGIKAIRSTLFELKPVPRGGEPFVFPVWDSFQNIVVVGQKERQPKPVPVQEIVDDVLARWTGGLHNVPTGAKPGIIQIAGSKPTRAEHEEMKQVQTIYFEFHFNKGEELHRQNKWDDITEVMRLGANWLGRDALWANPAIAMESGPCPLCTRIIPNAAIFCPECKQQIKAMPAELAAMLSGKPVPAQKGA
jgi:hypothetical protein